MGTETIFSWVGQPIYGYIHFINFGKESPIKIGYAKNIDKRIEQLQIGNPYELDVIIAIPGNINCEKILHEHLQKYEIRGEWFWPSHYIYRLIRKFKIIQDELVDYRHIVRKVIKDQSGECLSEICIGIKKYDLQVLRNKNQNEI